MSISLDTPGDRYQGTKRSVDDVGASMPPPNSGPTFEPVKIRKLVQNADTVDSRATAMFDQDRVSMTNISTAVMKAFHPHALGNVTDANANANANANVDAGISPEIAARKFFKPVNSIYTLPTEQTIIAYINAKFTSADTRAIANQITRNIITNPITSSLMQGAHQYNRITYETKNNKAYVRLVVVDATEHADIQLDIDKLRDTLANGISKSSHEFTITVGSIPHNKRPEGVGLHAKTRGLCMCITVSFNGQ